MTQPALPRDRHPKEQSEREAEPGAVRGTRGGRGSWASPVSLAGFWGAETNPSTLQSKNPFKIKNKEINVILF